MPKGLPTGLGPIGLWPVGLGCEENKWWGKSVPLGMRTPVGTTTAPGGSDNEPGGIVPEYAPGIGFGKVLAMDGL